jgi:arylsulfatase A-like enzyme
MTNGLLPQELSSYSRGRVKIVKRIQISWVMAWVAVGLIDPVSADSLRPNIVLIYADDLGWKDVGYNGSDFHETPHIDRLAREGMVFHQAYAGAGNCAPSRACLLSGKYTPRHGVYAVGSTDRGPKKSQRLIPIPNKSGLAPGEITLADAMKSAGYMTGIFGKWHLDGKEGASPSEQGFEVVFESQKGSPNERQERPADPKGVFSITRAAGDFIKKSATAQKPFFAYIPHHAIHSALEARPESLAKFTAKAPGKQHKNPLYAACTYDLDTGVGELIDLLQRLGISENTLVIFTSDNGGTGQASQEPLRGDKGGYYDGGIREPFVAWWPGTIKPSESQSIIHQIDLFPTLIALAGSSVPDGHTLDGESLLPLFKQTGSLSRSAVFWHFPGYLDKPVNRGREGDVRLGFRTRPVSIIRKGEWKLHLFHEEWVLDGGRKGLPGNNAVELYDMKNDPGERNNQASREMERVSGLVDELLAWMEKTKAPIPQEPNPEFDPQGKSDKQPRQKRKSN